MKFNLTEKDKKAVTLAQSDYILNKALHETVTKIGEEIQRDILFDNKYKALPKYGGNIITNPFNSYEMSDTDFKDYLAKVHKARTNKGMIYPDDNTTFDYQTFENLVESENRLIDAMLSVIPETLQDDFKNIKTSYKGRKQFIDLSMKLAV